MVDEKSDAALSTAADKGKQVYVLIHGRQGRKSTFRWRAVGQTEDGGGETPSRLPRCKGTPILILCWVAAGVRHSHSQQ